MTTFKTDNVKITRVDSDFFKFQSQDGMLLSELSLHSERFGISYSDGFININKNEAYSVQLEGETLIITKPNKN